MTEHHDSGLQPFDFNGLEPDAHVELFVDLTRGPEGHKHIGRVYSGQLVAGRVVSCDPDRGITHVEPETHSLIGNQVHSKSVTPRATVVVINSNAFQLPQ